jgi:hypothetical protein
MKRTWLAAALAASSVVLMSGFASAQEESTYYRQAVRAPRQAFELTLAPAYTQGFGDVSDPGVALNRMTDNGNAALGIGLGLGYRIHEYWSVGLIGQYNEINPAGGIDGGNVRGGFAGVDATYHFAPYRRVDPFLSFGAGYRVLWTNPPGALNNFTRHGVQLARAAVGLDLRVSPDVAIAPFVGADLNMFLFEDAEATGNRNLSDPRFNTFVQGGLQGRFDIGGRRVIPAASDVVVGRR